MTAPIRLEMIGAKRGRQLRGSAPTRPERALRVYAPSWPRKPTIAACVEMVNRLDDMRAELTRLSARNPRGPRAETACARMACLARLLKEWGERPDSNRRHPE